MKKPTRFGSKDVQEGRKSKHSIPLMLLLLRVTLTLQAARAVGQGTTDSTAMAATKATPAASRASQSLSTKVTPHGSLSRSQECVSMETPTALLVSRDSSAEMTKTEVPGTQASVLPLQTIADTHKGNEVSTTVRTAGTVTTTQVSYHDVSMPMNSRRIASEPATSTTLLFFNQAKTAEDEKITVADSAAISPSSFNFDTAKDMEGTSTTSLSYHEIMTSFDEGITTAHHSTSPTQSKYTISRRQAQQPTNRQGWSPNSTPTIQDDYNNESDLDYKDVNYSDCSVHVYILRRMEGHLEWNSSLRDCLTDVSWHIYVPENYVVTLKISDVQIINESYLEIHTPITKIDRLPLPFSRVYRKVKQSLGFSPFLSIYNSLRIVVSPTQNGYCSFNISYFAYPRENLPKRVYVNTEEETECLTKYECPPGFDIPEVFRCDMVEHCTDGSDEAGCDYKEDNSCGDWIPYGDYCLKAMFKNVFNSMSGLTQPIVPSQAEIRCQTMWDASLALLPDKAGMELVDKMIHYSGYYTAVVGLKKVRASPQLRHMYRFLWQWGGRGGHIAYEQQTIQRQGPQLGCAQIDIHNGPVLRPLPCALPDEQTSGFVCMRKNPTRPIHQHPTTSSVHFPEPYELFDGFPTKRCPDGSLVQIFYHCSWDGFMAEMPATSPSPGGLPLFQCRFGQKVHYSLVCDGYGDCADKSDEVDCVKPLFPPLLETSFFCRDGQVISQSLYCNGVWDCLDESDEDDCLTCTGTSVMCPGVGCLPKQYSLYADSCPNLPESKEADLLNSITERVSVSLDGRGMSKLAVKGNCSDSEFQCISRLCIPSFLVNNDVQDCRYGEDEHIPQENVTCPGYYRCDGVGLCLHPDFLCDGIYHCPSKDDERYCGITCPQNCTCEGYAYTCRETFDPLMYLQVRYLDLSAVSYVSLDNFRALEFLQYLNLSSCNLQTVYLADMSQLRVLDLSFNGLNSISSLKLYNLSGLVQLDLSNNPMMTVFDASFRTLLLAAGMRSLQALTIRNTDLARIEDRAFEHLPQLTTLDLRGNDIAYCEEYVFGGLNQLTVLYTDTSKLCCAFFLPHPIVCRYLVDEISSCSDLLSQDFFRVSLWSLSVLAIVCNAGCLAYRLCHKKQGCPVVTRVLLCNLAASDFIMGVYLVMIGTADVSFRGVYLLRDVEWKDSIACSVAGFLAFVSCEVSAFVVCLVTLERFLVLCFPLSPHCHMTTPSAIAACGLAWVLGLALAAFPLLAQWDFYGQNGMCLPLPVTIVHFQGECYAFGVFVILNFVLFLTTGCGQACVFHSVRLSATGAGTKHRRQETIIARRLFLIVATDFLCWFPIGLMGLLAFRGHVISSAASVWMTSIILPLNSAINPFLYTLNGLGDRWRRRREEARIKKTMGKLHHEIPKWPANVVEELTRICLKSKLVSKDRVLGWLGEQKPSVSPYFIVDDRTLVSQSSVVSAESCRDRPISRISLSESDSVLLSQDSAVKIRERL